MAGQRTDYYCPEARISVSLQDRSVIFIWYPPEPLLLMLVQTNKKAQKKTTTMADEQRRKSRRISGSQPAPLPPAAVAGEKTALRSLLATDSAHRRPLIDGNPVRAWNFDASSASLSSVSMPSPFACVAAALRMNNTSIDDEMSRDSGLFLSACSGDDPSSSEGDASTKLIQFDRLKHMIESKCACKVCGSPVRLRQETFGLATNLYLCCVPPDKRYAIHRGDAKADTIGLQMPNMPNDDGRHVAKDNAGKYLINLLLVLAMQQLGLGLVSVTTFLATLGIRSSMGNARIWKVIQDRVGIAEQAVREEVLAKNRARAIQAAVAFGAQKDDSGRVGLICSIDGGWQKRSSGRTYDSPSGHNLLVNGRTKLILDSVIYSKLCLICRRQMPAAASNDDSNDDVIDIADADVAGEDVGEANNGDNNNDDNGNDNIEPIVDDDGNDDDTDNTDAPALNHQCPKTLQALLNQWSQLVLLN